HLFARAALQARLSHRGDAANAGRLPDRPAGPCRPDRRRARRMNGALGPARANAPEDALVLDLRGLTKRFGARTVGSDRTGPARRGESYGLLGPSGSGKAPTIRMLSGRLIPQRGRLACPGFVVLTLSDAAKPAVAYTTHRVIVYDD